MKTVDLRRALPFLVFVIGACLKAARSDERVGSGTK
jgi:hypothetical protein